MDKTSQQLKVRVNHRLIDSISLRLKDDCCIGYKIISNERKNITPEFFDMAASFVICWQFH